MNRDQISEWWSYFSRHEYRGYSPLYERVSADVARSDALLTFLSELPDHAANPNLLMAVMHDRVLNGLEPTLAALYESRQYDEVGGEFVRAALAARGVLRPVLAQRRVQTNEVGRSSFLAPAIRQVVGESDFSLVDVGASAGLNLLFDSYRIDYGEHGALGPVDSPVVISCDVLAGSPPVKPAHPLARIGLDHNVMSASNGDDSRWLLACVWPDTGRLERTRAALELAANYPLDVRFGDAARDIAAILEPLSGLVVVSTTWVMAYLSEEDRQGFDEALARASQGRDVVWISAEAPGIVPGVPIIDSPVPNEGGATALVVRRYRNGVLADSWLQAHVHAHGRWLWWYDNPVRS